MTSGQQTRAGAGGRPRRAPKAGLHTMWSAVAPGWERERRLRRQPREGSDRRDARRGGAEARRAGARARLRARWHRASKRRSWSDRMGEVVLTDVAPRDDRDRRGASRGTWPGQRHHARSRPRGRSTSRTSRTTRCSAARASCWSRSPPGPRRRSGACCVRADARVVSVWGPRERNPWLGAHARRRRRAARRRLPASGHARPALARRRRQAPRGTLGGRVRGRRDRRGRRAVARRVVRRVVARAPRPSPARWRSCSRRSLRRRSRRSARTPGRRSASTRRPRASRSLG